MPKHDLESAGHLADNLIATEVAIQDKMWGGANERADSTEGQLLAAAVAQASAVWAANTMPNEPGGREGAFEVAKDNYYPKDWDGFRDYGSDVANLVVVAAFIRSEIKRRVLLGEDTTRTKRGEVYPNRNTPYMSSEQAAQEIRQH